MTVTGQLVPLGGGPPYIPTVPWTPALLPGIQAWYRAEPDAVIVDGTDVGAFKSLINGSSDDRSVFSEGAPFASYTSPDDFVEFTPSDVLISTLPMIASLPIDMRGIYATFSLTPTNGTFRVLQSWDLDGGDITFTCGVNPTNKIFASNSVNIATGTTTLAEATLYRAVFSFDSGANSLQAFLDAVLEAETAFLLAGTNRLLVGANALGFGFKGKLNELVISRARARTIDVNNYQAYSVGYFGP